MTRKDYELIARELREGMRSHRVSHQAERWTYHEIALRLADALAAENPRFDRDKFILACGWPA